MLVHIAFVQSSLLSAEPKMTDKFLKLFWTANHPSTCVMIRSTFAFFRQLYVWHSFATKLKRYCYIIYICALPYLHLYTDLRLHTLIQWNDLIYLLIHVVFYDHIYLLYFQRKIWGIIINFMWNSYTWCISYTTMVMSLLVHQVFILFQAENNKSTSLLQKILI